MKILNREEMQQADRHTIEHVGIPGYALMECAAQAMLEETEKYIADTFRPEREKAGPGIIKPSVTVLCGSGNNGGDGLVLARRLEVRGIKTSSWLCRPAGNLKDEALKAYAAFIRAGFVLNELNQDNAQELNNIIEGSDYIIDALLGTGTRGAVSDPFRHIIEAVNRSRARVISLDIPSGSDPDIADSICTIRADITLTVQFPKTGAYLHPGAQNYGKLITVDAGIIHQENEHSPLRYLWDEKMHNEHSEAFSHSLADDHKGKNGRALIIGGSRNMTGAPIMTAMACARSGAGLISVATTERGRASAQILIPEAMYTECEESDGFIRHVLTPEDSDIIAVGMGLGRKEASGNIISELLDSEHNILIDGDGLWFLKDMIQKLEGRKGITILTPHPGEMATLCSQTQEYIRNRRFEAARELSTRYGIYVVLKGPYTITSCPDGTQYVNSSGNQGLAKGGSGDILSGMIAGRMAGIMKKKAIYKEERREYHVEISESIIGRHIADAVYLHGRAADIITGRGRSITGMLPTDILAEI